MAYWDGQRWATDPDTPREQDSRAATWTATAVMLLGMVALLVPFGLAGAARPSTADCEVSPAEADVGETYVVSAWGLPTNSAINIWVTENGVTTGRPLGGTPDGTFNLNQSSSTAGETTYTFSGPVKPKMKVYATCTVSAY